MRWLVTGAGGMLAADLVPRLREEGHEVTAADRAALDVTAPQAVAAAVAGQDVVVTCAAWTAVDGAEEHEAQAAQVNVEAPRLLADACSHEGALLVHLTTDYVFGSPPDPQGGAPEP